MDRFQVVESFVRVAHGGSFTKAAMQLGLSRALISRRIMDLEARLGVRLLNRSTRSVSLTEEGSAYLVHCEQLLNDMETAEREIARSGKAPLGTIRVLAPKSFGVVCLSDAVIAFSHKHPQIRVSLSLVNNAGRGMKYISSSFMTEPTRFWEADASAWRSVIDTNINGPFLMARAAVRPMLRGRWGRIINISMNRDTMQRAGFSPYGPSKAALESETIIWAQDLAGTGVTVNALLPGGATLTGMIPPGVPQHVRASLLDPGIMIRPLLWMVSPASDGITGKRLVANRWRMDVDDAAAAQSAMLDAGWGAPATATGSP